MKFLFNKRLKSIVLIATLSSFVYLGTGNEQKPELSQTVPPDMVYVKGNDSIHSFYISVTEEPNINWRIYTDWLQNVYVDFPEVHEQALPLRDMQATSSQYNDPIIDNYANHPAYNYYPVVGVSWSQVQDYLHWKTDRLNEIILVKNRFTILDFKQVDDDNFNTETFLEGQFMGKEGDSATFSLLEKNKGYYDYSSSYKFNANKFIMNNGIFIPHYRLPTEAEWDYANNYSRSGISSRKKYSIYGNNYFLNSWDKFSDKNSKPKKYPVYPYLNELQSGIQEWLMDNENFRFKSGFGSYDVYIRNGFKNSSNAQFDADGVVVSKDSLGRFNFFLVDYDNLNKPIYVVKPYIPRYKTEILEIENPFYQNKELFEKYKNKLYDFGANGQYYIYPTMENNLLNEKYFKIAMQTNVLYVGEKRKIKSGNWKNPGTKTYLLHENEASQLIGFRCVLPATAVAVNPKYKVKWD